MSFVAVGCISAAGHLEKTMKNRLMRSSSKLLRRLDSGKISNLKGLIFLRSSSWMISQKKSARVYSTARSFRLVWAFWVLQYSANLWMFLSFNIFPGFVHEHNQSWCIAILPIGMLKYWGEHYSETASILVSTAVWQLKVKLSLCINRL